MFKIHAELFGLLIAVTLVTSNHVLAQGSNNADYYLSRATNSLTIDDIDSAEKHFTTAREISGDTAEINLRIAELYIEYAGTEYERALSYLETALSKQPSLARARFLLGQIYYNNGIYTKSVDSLERLLDDSDYGIYAQYYLGIIDYQERRYSSARSRFESVMNAEEVAILHESSRSYLDAIVIASKRWSAYGVATLNYDSNPQLLPEIDTSGTEVVVEQGNDYALIVQGQGKYTLIQGAKIDTSASYQLYDIRYNDLERLDQQGNILGLESTYQFDQRLSFTGAYGVEFWTLDGRKLQQTQRISGSLIGKPTSVSEATLSYRFSDIDRYNDASGAGTRHKATIYYLHNLSDDWRAGIGGAVERVEVGQDQKSNSKELSLDLYAPTLRQFQAQAGISYSHTDHTGFATADFLEYETKTSAFSSVTRGLIDHLYLRLGASYERNRSDSLQHIYERYQLNVGLMLSY